METLSKHKSRDKLLIVTNKIKISQDEKSISNKDHLSIRQPISYIFELGQTLAM